MDQSKEQGIAIVDVSGAIGDLRFSENIGACGNKDGERNQKFNELLIKRNNPKSCQGKRDRMTDRKRSNQDQYFFPIPQQVHRAQGHHK